jgi:hypothetical protein
VSPWTRTSSYTGKVSEFVYYVCSFFGSTFDLVHGSSATRIVDGSGNVHAEGEGTSETLHIQCSPPTPTPIGGPCGSSTEGDADGDFDVDAIDALFVLQYAAGLPRTLICPANGDFNNVSGITSVDGTLILQFVAGLI